MKYKRYIPLALLLKGVARLPLGVLYCISDFIYLLVYRVVGYRKSMVRGNMASCFPEKEKKELRKMERDFYHYFCDYMVETIKLLHISRQEIMRRMTFVNIELMQRLVDENKAGILLLGHYGNWEWVPSIKLWLHNDENATIAHIHRAMKNEWFDAFFIRLRQGFDTLCIEKKETLRVMSAYRRSGRTLLTGFIADQTPSPANIHLWVPFLNHDTAALTGAEKIARKNGEVVLYLDMRRLKRGYYEGRLVMIKENPKVAPEFEITRRYMEQMEQTILRAPQYWLWTHNRWKHTH